MKYPMKLPLDREGEDYGANLFEIEMWDWDLMGGNQIIGHTNFDLDTHEMLRKCYKRKTKVECKQLLDGKE